MYLSSASNTIKKYDANDNYIETIYNKDFPDWGDRMFLGYMSIVMVEDSNGNFYSIDSDEIYDFVVDETKIKLEPGESLYLLVGSQWPNTEEFSENGIKYVATSSFTVDWEQYVE